MAPPLSVDLFVMAPPPAAAGVLGYVAAPVVVSASTEKSGLVVQSVVSVSKSIPPSPLYESGSPSATAESS